MKINIIAFIFFVVFSHLAVGQIDDIKKNTDKNNKKNQTDNKSSTDNNINSPHTDDSPCLDACVGTCMNVVISLVAEAIIDHHHHIMANYRSGNPKVLSFEVMPQFATGYYFSGKNMNMDLLPRLRGNWGVLSTDFRFNFLSSYKNYTVDAYKTWEWTILMLNLMPDEETKFSLGTGIMVDEYSKSRNYNNYIYNEHYMGIETSTNNSKMIYNFEGRIATSYDQPPMFVELGFRLNYRFLEFKHCWGYFTTGFTYQNYNASVDLYMVHGGLMFNLH